MSAHTERRRMMARTLTKDDGKHPLWLAVKLKYKVSKGYAIALCRYRKADPYIRVDR